MPASSAASPSTSPNKGPRPATKRPLQDFPEVIGGRFWIALALLLSMSFVPYCEPLRRAIDKQGPPALNPADWKVGTTHTIKLTVVTADYEHLDCAYPSAIEGKHCSYKTQTETWPRRPGEPLDNNKLDIIQPYRTWPDNLLLAVSNLWTFPDVAMRLHNEPPANIPKEKLGRFVAQCEVKFIGEFDRPHLRWFKTSPWGQEGGKVPVGNAVNCKIVPDDL
ncbi:MAG: hypothetical protein SFV15_16255 [Polyangiaceae bacterium]|nr:hypothetical protein [Polyangiaceae bacterium]